MDTEEGCLLLLRPLLPVTVIVVLCHVLLMQRNKLDVKHQDGKAGKDYAHVQNVSLPR